MGPALEGMQKIWAIAHKDLLTELRTREGLVAMAFFALLVLFTFTFALGPDQERLREAAPGLLWVAFTFTALLGVSRAGREELENGCWDALLLYPVPREVIYLGKFLGSFCSIVVVEAVMLPLFALLFNLDIWNAIPSLLTVALLGTVGLASLGTLLAAMTVTLRSREALLPILLLPVALPLLLSAVKATEGILVGATLTGPAPWIKLLAVYDVVFLAASLMTFEFIVEG